LFGGKKTPKMLMPSSKPGSSGGLLSPTKRCLCRRRSWPILQIWDDWEIIILPWDSWSSTHIIRIKNVGMSPVSVTKQDSGIGVTWAPRWINWTLYTYICIYICLYYIYMCVSIYLYIRVLSYPNHINWPQHICSCRWVCPNDETPWNSRQFELWGV